MPFFFIVPMWLLCVVGGLVLCLFRQFRILSPYLVLTSTGGLIVSVAASTFVLWIGPKLLTNGSRWAGLIMIVAYLAGIVIGGVAGVIVGFLAARRIHQRLQLA